MISILSKKLVGTLFQLLKITIFVNKFHFNRLGLSVKKAFHDLCDLCDLCSFSR